MQHNTHVDRRSQKKSSELLPLPSDKQPEPASNLQDFKALCKRLGIAWNPVKN